MATRTLSIALTVSLALLASGCGKPEEVAPEAPVRPVKIFEIQPGGLDKQIELPGQILPLKQANMAFEVPGVMIEMLVEESEEVEAGQLLARIDQRDYEANRDAAKAQFEVAQIEAERTQALYERQAASQQRLDMAISNMKVAEASYERAEKAYQDTYMRSPITGVVAKILVDDVANVQAKQQILIVQDLSAMKVVMDLPETLTVFAEPDVTREEHTAAMKPMVFLSFLPGRGFPAEFSEFSLMADSATRTYEGTLTFQPPEDLIILPGMTAKVQLTFSNRDGGTEGAFAVPMNALTSDPAGQSKVWVVDADSMTVSETTVETGLISGEMIEVVSQDLRVGDRVVTSGVQFLKAGDEVREF